MASQLDGSAVYRSNTQAKTGWTVEELTEDDSVEKTELTDEDGDIISVLYFSRRTAFSATLVAASGTTMVNANEIFVLKNHAGTEKTIRLETVSNAQKQKEFMRTTVTGTLYAGITPT